jgi:hypothetical protein
MADEKKYEPYKYCDTCGERCGIKDFVCEMCGSLLLFRYWGVGLYRQEGTSQKLVLSGTYQNNQFEHPEALMAFFRVNGVSPSKKYVPVEITVKPLV